MSVKATSWAFEQDLKTGPKFVLVALADHCDGDGVCWPGHARVAEKCGISRQTVVEHIAFLIAAGLVRAESHRDARGKVIRTRYFLAVDGPFIQSTPPSEKDPSMSGIPTRVGGSSMSGFPTRSHVGISGPSMSGFPVPYKEEPKAFESPPNPQGGSLFEAKNPDVQAWFEKAFWPEYPKHTGKAEAMAALLRLRPDETLLEVILEGLKHRTRGEQQAVAKGLFFPAWPDAHRWLKKRRWEDRYDVSRGTYAEGLRCASCGAPGVVSDGRKWWCAHHDPLRRAA
ncbi:MAG: helix-turn-helix domain-containing protein [Phycisphaerales bacterium]|nr:helix-turn-helix domain-containing protein [Phycisphaerales bacterium]